VKCDHINQKIWKHEWNNHKQKQYLVTRASSVNVSSMLTFSLALVSIARNTSFLSANPQTSSKGTWRMLARSLLLPSQHKDCTKITIYIWKVYDVKFIVCTVLTIVTPQTRSAYYTCKLIIRTSIFLIVKRGHSSEYGPSVNKEYLSQIQLYLIFGELTVLSNMVLIITVCAKVANSTFLVTNKGTKWAEFSRYYLCNCFVR